MQELRRSARLPHVEMRRVMQATTCYDTHSHDEFSFGVVDAGHATYRNHRHQAAIHQGISVFFNPGDAHACNPRPGQPWSYRMLFVDAAWVARLQAESAWHGGGDYAPFTLRHSNAPRVYQQFDQLFNALEQDHNAEATDAQLADFLLTHCFAQPRAAQAQPTGALKRTRDCILDQLANNLTLDDLAHTAGLSRYHLLRSFKQAYGQTPHAFQLDQRINQGKQLLKRGGSLADVAHSLGFADQSHFQRHFKRRHAVTPRVYQQSLEYPA
jgi:AraC-like DNA-binding protein